MVKASLKLGLVLALQASLAEGQSRLGDVPAGGELRIQLQEIVPLSRLRIEIDGVPTDVGLSLSGRTLVVTLPENLGGREHDIVLFRRQPDADVELGIWTFSTPTGQVETTMAGTVEIERRVGQDGGQYRFSGNGRLGFNLDDGLLRGGIGFVQTDTSRRDASTEVTDYFLETRGAVLGQDLVGRLGVQTLPAENLLLEDGSWRGASLRLVHPGGRSDVTAFALQPGEASGRSNLTGLENPNERIAGIAGRFFPIGTSSLRTDLVVFDGRADLGDGKAENVKGAGWRLSGPIGADLGDFSLDYARMDSQATDATDISAGDAWSGEIGVGLLPRNFGSSLELRFSAARTQAAFLSPLNPDLIADESRQSAELIYQSDEWQWNLSAEHARSNIDNDTALPTDKFRELGLDVTYSPYVFTGGFLQGVTFYGSLNSEDQTRIFTPEGGSSAEDFRLQSLSFGMDKFQPDYALALGLKLDWLQDLSGAGADERRQRFESAFAFTPNDQTTLTLSAEAGRSEKTGTTLRDATLEMSYGFPFSVDRWSAFVEAGATWVEQDDTETGGYFGVEVKRDLSAAMAVLFRADYGQRAAAGELTPGEGWTFGLALRHDFGSASK